MIATSDRRPGRVGASPSCDPGSGGARHARGLAPFATALSGLLPFSFFPKERGMKKSFDTGLVRRDEAYSKTKVMERLGISQSFWDKMLDDGLPFASVGHGRWVTGESLFRYFEKIAECKQLAT